MATYPALCRKGMLCTYPECFCQPRAKVPVIDAHPNPKHRTYELGHRAGFWKGLFFGSIVATIVTMIIT